MIWATTLEAVDVNTGELLNGIKKDILKNYKVLRKTKKITYVNTEFARIHLTWECIPKPKQLKLKL